MSSRLSLSTASSYDYDDDDAWSSTSPTSSASSLDEEAWNTRLNPHWSNYRSLIENRGFKLETHHDARQYYIRRNADFPTWLHSSLSDDDICSDPGLPSTLFRGICRSEGRRVVIKAVHCFSRELEVIRHLSSPALRNSPENHTIPVLDIIDCPERQISFIVQEEWSNQLIIPSSPPSLECLLRALQQCIEGVAFMHANSVAHLDISLRNTLTDFKHHYAFIDFEMSQLFTQSPPPLVKGCRGTDLPPEIERGEASCPYKIDIWSLGVLVLRACKLTNWNLPDLIQFASSMLADRYEKRPGASEVLEAFDRLARHLVPPNGPGPSPSWV